MLRKFQNKWKLMNYLSKVLWWMKIKEDSEVIFRVRIRPASYSQYLKDKK